MKAISLALLAGVVAGRTTSIRPAHTIQNLRTVAKANALPASSKTLGRNVAAKASGYQHLDGMYGKVYDNVIFRNKNGWDPAGLVKDADAAKIDRYRDSELVHGRMAMLAILGQLFAEAYHPLFPAATGTAWQQYETVNSIAGPMFLYGFMAHVHGQEGLRYSERYESLGKLKEGQQPGVYGWDPLNLGKHLTEDEKAARNAQEVMKMISCTFYSSSSCA
mmetsp:Transcript_7449/g.10475  ORF Transcript_7449/g.10475 Transcript_7449/m.10475 type:complete len:220 (+) Transcript_7449:107-766(+)